MRFRIHPLFYALALLLVLFGQAAAFLWTLAAVCLHEAGHALAARARGYVVREVTLYPYGAAMSANERMDGASCVIVGLAGPAANFLAAALILALWWLFPAIYPFTHHFLTANLRSRCLTSSPSIRWTDRASLRDLHATALKPCV